MVLPAAETVEILQFVGRKAAEHVHCDAGGVAGTTLWGCPGPVSLFPPPLLCVVT